MTHAHDDARRREAAFQRASEQGLIRLAAGQVVVGHAVPVRDATSARVGRTGARAAANAGAAAGITPAARANRLRGRIAFAQLGAPKSEHERIAREVTDAFERETA